VIVIKTPEEIERMRRAGQMAALALDVVVQAVEPGVATEMLDRLADTFIRDHGGIPSFKDYRGYPRSICVSVDEEVVHGIPGRRRLVEGTIVSIDLGVLLEGFHGDVARTVAVGKVDQNTRLLLETTENALQAGVEEAREGRTLGDLGSAIQRVVEAAGFAVVRDFAGHGIGRSLHEDPQVPNYGMPGKGLRLRRGITLAIEPMVNAGGFEVEVLRDGWTVRTRDGSRSAHFEHTVAVGPNAPDVLTRLPAGAQV